MTESFFIKTRFNDGVIVESKDVCAKVTFERTRNKIIRRKRFSFMNDDINKYLAFY
jgi:hypothetical protein